MITPKELTKLPGTIKIQTSGLYELWMMVQWDENTSGTRFSHTKILNSEAAPLHSEAISADVLSKISGGKQILRSVCYLHTYNEIYLEVWHDAPENVNVEDYYLRIVREL